MGITVALLWLVGAFLYLAAGRMLTEWAICSALSDQDSMALPPGAALVRVLFFPIRYHLWDGQFEKRFRNCDGGLTFEAAQRRRAGKRSVLREAVLAVSWPLQLPFILFGLLQAALYGALWLTDWAVHWLHTVSVKTIRSMPNW